jgi:uncharacterized protein
MIALPTELPEEGDPRAHLLITHGASQPMNSRFFETMVPVLLASGLAVSRFEFAYMADNREHGKRRPPPRIEKLFPEFMAAVKELRAEIDPGQKLVIGGKSMGGRIASMLADELFSEGKISGLVCLGYPFHPPKKPENLRTAHLADLRTPALFAQGDRDPFGTKEDVAGYELSSAIQIHWVDDGDHDFAPRVKSGFTRQGNIEAAAVAVAEFASTL